MLQVKFKKKISIRVVICTGVLVSVFFSSFLNFGQFPFGLYDMFTGLHLNTKASTLVAILNDGSVRLLTPSEIYPIRRWHVSNLIMRARAQESRARNDLINLTLGVLQKDSNVRSVNIAWVEIIRNKESPPAFEYRIINIMEVVAPQSLRK